MPSPDVICQIDSEIEIRQYRDEDAESIAHHGNSYNVWKNLTDRIPHPYLVEDAKEWMERTRQPETQQITGPSLDDPRAPRVPANYVITIKGETCGTIGLVFGTSIYRRNASLGYWLGEAYHGKGIMSRLVPVFVKWVWQTFGYLVRLEGSAFESNIQSQVVMQRAGLTLESTRIKGCIKSGVLINEVLMVAFRPVEE